LAILGVKKTLFSGKISFLLDGNPVRFSKILKIGVKVFKAVYFLRKKKGENTTNKLKKI